MTTGRARRQPAGGADRWRRGGSRASHDRLRRRAIAPGQTARFPDGVRGPARLRGALGPAPNTTAPTRAAAMCRWDWGVQRGAQERRGSPDRVPSLRLSLGSPYPPRAFL